MASWFVQNKRADFYAIAERFGISPITARLLRNRDLTEQKELELFLHGSLDDISDPMALFGMEQAVAILEEKIRVGAYIRVIGDYDADGVCASFILHRGLELAGARTDTAIPHRVRDGYGLSTDMVLEAIADGVDTILTCDNGIAAIEQIALAKEKGMTVIVTDHHEVPFEDVDGERRYKLPQADVVVDPKQPEETAPFTGICGAFVALKLILALYDRLNLKQKLSAQIWEFQEAAAIATICDVMELRDENRILVKAALAHMSRTTNQGLRALLEVNGIQDDVVSAWKIGFVVGPCINATGRLDSAERALQLLEANNREKAVHLAAQLKQLNDERKDMTEAFVAQAAAGVEQGTYGDDRVLVIYLPECHESIAGIIAGRVRERYNKPVFVLTKGEEGIKGSGRSIETYNMFEAMNQVKECFRKFGGHKMAAGLTLAGEDPSEFRQKINAVCTLTDDDLQERVHIDMELPISYVNLPLLQEFEQLEPYGTGNKSPLFVQRDVCFRGARVLGKNGNTIRFSVQDDRGMSQDMMWFGGVDVINNYMAERFGTEAVQMLYRGAGDIHMHVVYAPQINLWNGRTNAQFVMKYYR